MAKAAFKFSPIGSFYSIMFYAYDALNETLHILRISDLF